MNWISVKERLPEKNATLLITNGRYITIGEWDTEHEWAIPRYDRLMGFYDVTHWMPLPELPQQQEQQNSHPPTPE